MKTQELVEIFKFIKEEIRKENSTQTKFLNKKIIALGKELKDIQIANGILLKEIKSNKKRPIRETKSELSIDDVINNASFSKSTVEVPAPKAHANPITAILEETAKTADLSHFYDPNEYAEPQTLSHNTVGQTAVPTQPAPTQRAEVNTTLIPTTDPEGKALNFKRVPEQVLQNIATPDYSKFMDKLLVNPKYKGRV